MTPPDCCCVAPSPTDLIPTFNHTKEAIMPPVVPPEPTTLRWLAFGYEVSLVPSTNYRNKKKPRPQNESPNTSVFSAGYASPNRCLVDARSWFGYSLYSVHRFLRSMLFIVIQFFIFVTERFCVEACCLCNDRQEGKHRDEYVCTKEWIKEENIGTRIGPARWK